MSFASEAKSELCRVKRPRKCCAVAECYGILLHCSSFTSREIRILTGHAGFASMLPRLFRKAFGVSFDSLPGPEVKPGARSTLLITAPDKITAVFRAFGMEPDDTLTLHINLGVLENDCCKSAFVRGAFLAGGSMTDPAKRYHLEMATTHAAVSREMCALLGELGFESGLARRSGSYVVYFKQSEAIADFLTLIGADVSAMGTISARVEKDMRNEINRKVNCDTANADKTVAAAQEQLEAIRQVERERGLDSLPEGLQQAALLRIANPEASLADLAALSAPSVTKSCLSHRLKRIVALAREKPEEN